MAIDKEQVKALLGCNLTYEVVASTVGCETAYISELMADQVFRDSVISLRVVSQQKNTERDKNIDSLEDAVIDRLQQIVPYLHKPNEVFRAFQVLNAAKRRGSVSLGGTVVPNQIVHLTVPVQLVQQFKKSSTGEIIEVDGDTLQTIPTHELLRKLASRDEGGRNGTRYEEVRKYLPNLSAGAPATEGAE